eukprot:260998_1
MSATSQTATHNSISIPKQYIPQPHCYENLITGWIRKETSLRYGPIDDSDIFANKSGIALRILFSEHKHENEHKQYLKVCIQLERKAKNVTWETCPGFWGFWEFQQSKCRSSSMACEPIGNITGNYGSRKTGKSLEHDEIERNVRIKGSLKATKPNRRIICEGVMNWLVDISKGVLKSCAHKNKKVQKYPETGKVLLRLNEAVNTRKYHVPMMVNSMEIRSTLHQINVKNIFDIQQLQIDQDISNHLDSNDEKDVDMDVDCNMQCNTFEDIEQQENDEKYVGMDLECNMQCRIEQQENQMSEEDKSVIDFEDIEKNTDPADFQNAKQALTDMVDSIIVYTDVNTYMENIDIEINAHTLFCKLKQTILDLENIDATLLVTFHENNELLQYIVGRIAVSIDVWFVRDILLFKPDNVDSIDKNDITMLKRHIQDMVNKRIYAKMNVWTSQEEILQSKEDTHWKSKKGSKTTFVPVTMNQLYLSLTHTICNNEVLLQYEKRLIYQTNQAICINMAL